MPALLSWEEPLFSFRGDGGQEPHQHRGDLGPGGSALGPQTAVLKAQHQALGVGPGQGLLGIGADGAGIPKARQVGPLADVVALAGGIAVQDGRQLLPGDVIPGANSVSLTPFTMPFWAAQATASVYQVPAATSANPLSPPGSGSPARRYRMVTSWALVVSLLGANRPAPTPSMSPV